MQWSEFLYNLIGLAVAGLGVAAWWIHATLYDESVGNAPHRLSDAELRRILRWGKIIRRFNARSPKGEQVFQRMQAALEGLRRRR